MPVPEKHILVCTDSDCRKRGGRKVCKAFKRALDEHDLKRRIKVLEIECFDQCAHGPMVVVYPDAVWYAGMREADVERVVEEHLEKGEPVREKLYRRAHKPLGEAA
jgi:(2Fe-2S) ferredoxin